jgi:hypothetical protein
MQHKIPYLGKLYVIDVERGTVRIFDESGNALDEDSIPPEVLVRILEYDDDAQLDIW